MRCIGLGFGVALASALAVSLLAIDFHGIYLGVAGWALLLATVCFAFWLGALIPRHCVVRGGAIVLFPDRIVIPRAFSGPAEEVALTELEIEVHLRPVSKTVVIEGVRRVVPSAVATRVVLGQRDRPRTLHPSVFANASHPIELANDIQRLRGGLLVEEHDAAQIEAPKDEYDQRLDEELHALDARKKSDKK